MLAATVAGAGTKPATCRRCNGHGVVVQSQGFFRMQQTCRGCGGRGAIITDPCPTCHGRGRVVAQRTSRWRIPPGVDTGTRIRLERRGRGRRARAPARRPVLPDPRPRAPVLPAGRRHLICQVPITFSQAALGGDIEVPTLGRRHHPHLKRGIQSGEVVRIAGQGMPNLHGGRQGDLLVQMIVETPRHLTKRQEELFRELAELDHKHVPPQRQGFLDKLKSFFATDQPGKSGEVGR